MSAPTCGRCARPMWRSGTPRDQRPAGAVLHTGRGLCTTCYGKASQNGTLPAKASSPAAPERDCDRCGITTTEPDLCVDCRDVLELDEQHSLLEAVS